MSLINQPKLPVESYGLYRDNDSIAWLLQQGTSESAIGLPNRSCPFRIKTHLKLCTHKFNLTINLEGDKVLREYEFLLPYSDLLKAFDPVVLLSTKEPRATYFESENANLIVKAQQILNPNGNYTMSGGLAKEHFSLISKRLCSSNLASFIVYGLQPEHLKTIDNLLHMAPMCDGKLILCGQRMALYNTKDLVDVRKVDDKTNLFLRSVTNEQLNQIGSYRLKKFMRS